MASNALAHSDPYVLQVGAAAVRRLQILHSIYWPMGQRILYEAGIAAGMKVADFGCGVGVVSRMLGRIVGDSGSVTGIDVNEPQLMQARRLCAADGLTNTRFVAAGACETGLPDASFDLVYCRFLLLHLPDPHACLREMFRVLRPGGIVVVEDGDLTSAASVPPTALNAFADLFGRLGPLRGVDYTLANNLFHMVAAAGFAGGRIHIHQPADTVGENCLLLTWSVAEAGPAFINAGLITRSELNRTIAEMEKAGEDPSVLVLAPRMSLVWARKPVV